MITAKHINAQGLVPLWEATDDGHRQVMLAAVDANHALSVDPERWFLPDEPGGPPPARSASESGSESAAAADLDLRRQPSVIQYHPDPTDPRSESEKGSG